MNAAEMVNNGGVVIDVRTPEEYRGGHVSGSLNIPLMELPDRIEELKEMNVPLILCCASGNRSGQAERFLKNAGINCINGGSWMEVNYIISDNLFQTTNKKV